MVGGILLCFQMVSFDSYLFLVFRETQPKFLVAVKTGGQPVGGGGGCMWCGVYCHAAVRYWLCGIWPGKSTGMCAPEKSCVTRKPSVGSVSTLESDDGDDAVTSSLSLSDQAFTMLLFAFFLGC